MAGVEVTTIEVPPSPLSDSFMTDVVLSPVNNPQHVEQVFLQIMKDNGNDTTSFVPQEIQNKIDNHLDIGRAEITHQAQTQQTILETVAHNGTLTISPATTGKTENETVLDLTIPPIQQLQPQLLQDLTPTFQTPLFEQNVIQNCENLDPKPDINQFVEEPILQIATQNVPFTKTTISSNQYQNEQMDPKPVINQFVEKPILQILTQNEVPVTDTTISSNQHQNEQIDPKPGVNQFVEKPILQILTQNEVPVPETTISSNQHQNEQIDPKPGVNQFVEKPVLQILTQNEVPVTDTTISSNQHQNEQIDPKPGVNQFVEKPILQILTQNEVPVPETTISSNQYQNGQNFTLSPAKSSQLEETLLQVVTENSSLVMPLIKEDLRNKIKSRRESQGLGEIKVEFTPPQNYELRPDEIVKRDARKMRNRHSARISRERRKSYEKRLEKEIDELEKERDRRTKTVESLQNFETKLRARFADHLNRCNEFKRKWHLLQCRNHTLP